MIVQSWPPTLIAATYTEMPFPILHPMQEVVFDLGVTATDHALDLRGVVIKATAATNCFSSSAGLRK